MLLQWTRQSSSLCTGCAWSGAPLTSGVMRVPKVLGVALALTAVGILTAAIGARHAVLRPPVFGLVSVESAGIFDDGGEMSLVTLAISNPYNQPRPENTLYLKSTDKAKTLAARVTNVWVEVEGTLSCGLPCRQKVETVFLLPAGTDLFRISLHYTGSSPSFKRSGVKARLEWLTERLPLSVRSRLSYKFWRWVGFGPDYLPSSDWRALTVEIPLSGQSRGPTGAFTGVHNERAAVDAGFRILSTIAGRRPGTTEHNC